MSQQSGAGDGATVWLGLGSNLGDRRANLATAVAALQGILQVDAVSDVVETPPFGHADQPDFLNLVLRGRTALAPTALLAQLKRLEVELGRVPTFRMGPRRIDMDILMYGDVVLDEPALVLPHPGISQRPFVLVPLLQLDPDLRSPVDALPWARFLNGAARASVRSLGSLNETVS